MLRHWRRAGMWTEDSAEGEGDVVPAEEGEDILVCTCIVLGRVHAYEKAQKIARNPIFSKVTFV